MQIHLERFRGHPFPDRQQRDAAKSGIVRVFLWHHAWDGFITHTFNQHPHGGETFTMLVGRPQDQPNRTAAFRRELKPAGIALVELRKRRDHSGDSRATKRLIHRPECVFFVCRAEDYETIERDPVTASCRRIEITKRIDQDNAPVIFRRGTGFQPVTRMPSQALLEFAASERRGGLNILTAEHVPF